MSRPASAALLCLLLLATTRAGAAPADRPEAVDERAVARGGLAFGVDVYSRLASRPGNLFFSPFGISAALSLAYAGASGATASEMSKALHLSLPGRHVHDATGRLVRGLNRAGGGDTLIVADAVWSQKGAAILGSFQELARRDYGAEAGELDFKGASEQARKTINQWVSEKTAGRIGELIAPGTLNGLSRLVLTNAVYFKGKWAFEFAKKSSYDAPFHVTPGKEPKTRFMTQTGQFPYFETEALQVLELPYRGDAALVALLPRDRQGLAALEKSLSAKALGDWLGRLENRSVTIHFPLFRMTRQFSLSQELQALGMREAFDADKADFSLINGKKAGDRDALAVTDVIHQAFVEVNEEGTEAAAATVVAFGALDSALPGGVPVVFRADHPFLFLIRDRRSGVVLFLGRVLNPAE